MKTYCNINVCQEHLFELIDGLETVDTDGDVVELDAIERNSEGELPECDACLLQYDEGLRNSVNVAIITVKGKIDIEKETMEK